MGTASSPCGDSVAPGTTGATPAADAAPCAQPVASRDGRRLWLRSIVPADVDALRRCFTRLSEDEIRMRFLYPMYKLPEPMAWRLCNTDPENEVALVLMDRTTDPPQMRGVGRLFLDRTLEQAEFSVLVEKAWTGLGLGALLMQHLVDICRRRGLNRIWGRVLIENRPMLDLCRQLGFERQALAGEPGIAQITLDLDLDPSPG